MLSLDKSGDKKRPMPMDDNKKRNNNKYVEEPVYLIEDRLQKNRKNTYVINTNSVVEIPLGKRSMPKKGQALKINFKQKNFECKNT